MGLGSIVKAGTLGLVDPGEGPEAAGNAAAAQAQALNRAINLQRDIYEQGREDLAPFRATGTQALNNLAGLFGINQDRVLQEQQREAKLRELFEQTGGEEFTTLRNVVGLSSEQADRDFSNLTEQQITSFDNRTGNILRELRDIDRQRGGGVPQPTDGTIQENPQAGGGSNAQDIAGLFDNRGAGLFDTLGQALDSGFLQDNGGQQRSVSAPQTTTDRFAPQGTQGGAQNARQNALADFFTSPGYNFRLDQGIEAIERSNAARGRLNSGATLQDLSRFGQGLASQEFNNYANRLASLAGVGQSATNAGVSQGQNFASQQGNLLGQLGNARASGYVGAFNADPLSANSLLGLGSNLLGGLLAGG